MLENLNSSQDIKVMNLIISDDSPVVRVRLSHILGELKNVNIVGEAEDVQKSIAIIEELKPDIVILDISMPGGSGLDVLKNIREKFLRTKVIILTNYSFPQYRKICMDSGADYFFDKSNEFDKVVDVLKEL